MDKNLILGGVFATHTEVDEQGNVVERDEFHLRLYWELFHSGAIKKLKGAKLHALLAIAMHADRRAESWPTIEDMAEILPYSKNAISSAVAGLEEDGFIEREQQRGEKGKFGNMKYRIRYTSPATVSQKVGDGENPHEIKDSAVSQKVGDGDKTRVSGSTVSHFSGDRKLGYKEEKDDIKDDIKTNNKDDKRAREKNDPVELKDLDLSFLPDDYPREIRRIIEKRPGLFPTLDEAMTIYEKAVWAHGKASHLLGYEIPFDSPLAAKVLRDVIRVSALKQKKGDEIKDFPAYYHNALRDRLFAKHVEGEKRVATETDAGEFALYDWVKGEG